MFGGFGLFGEDFVGAKHSLFGSRRAGRPNVMVWLGLYTGCCCFGCYGFSYCVELELDGVGGVVEVVGEVGFWFLVE